MTKKIIEYIITVFFKDWKMFEGIAGLAISAIAYLLPNTTNNQKLIIFVFGLFLIFIVKLIKQYFKLYLNYHHPIKVIRKVQGDGVYQGQDIIVLQNSDNLRDGLLLTLHCKSSGADQPVCILEIINSTHGEDIITKQVIPDPTNYDINKYFEEDSRQKSLYAKPLISAEEIKTFLKINNDGKR